MADMMVDLAERIYLDWNATTPLRPEARAAMAHAWEIGGNPSSVHAEGREARRLVEDARAAVAAAVGAEAQNVVFTAGGTEANSLALTPGLRGGGQEKGRRAGTEDVAGIAGFAAAARAALVAREPDAISEEGLRTRLEAGLREAPGTVIFAGETKRLPNTVLFTVPGMRAET